MPTSLMRQSPNVLAQELRDERACVVLLNPTNGEYYTLEDVGARIWALCDGSRSADEIASTIAAEYDGPADTVISDVGALLQELVHEGLVVVG